MDSAPQFYCETFPDLTPLGGLSKPARTWARGRAWRSGPLAYNRKPAIKVAVTMEQHGVLLGGLKRSVNAWWAIRNAIDAMWPDEFLLEGKTRADYDAHDPTDPKTWLAPPVCGWPEGMSVRLMEKFKTNLEREGLDNSSVEYLTAMKAAGQAVRTYRKQVETGGRAFTYADLDATGGVTVRLPAGAVHGAPVRLGDGFLELGRFGKVKPLEDAPSEAAGCAYVEMAHWERAWHVRFITTTERAVVAREAKERAPRGRKPSKAADVPAIAAPAAQVAEPAAFGGVTGVEFWCRVENGRIVEPRISNPVEEAEYARWRNWLQAHDKSPVKVGRS